MLKTTMGYHLILARMASIFFLNEHSCRSENFKLLYTVAENVNGATGMENSTKISKELKIESSYDPTTLLLIIYPKELKSGS